MADRQAPGILIQHHIIVREVRHACLQAGERGRGLAGTARSTEEDPLPLPSHQAGVERLQPAIPMPEEQLGMKRAPHLVLGQAGGITDPADDPPALSVESGPGLRKGRDDVNAAGGDLGGAGGLQVVLGEATLAGDPGRRFVPEVHREFARRRGPIGHPEMGQRAGDDFGEPPAHNAEPSGLSGEIVAVLRDAPGMLRKRSREGRRQVSVDGRGRI